MRHLPDFVMTIASQMAETLSPGRHQFGPVLIVVAGDEPVELTEEDMLGTVWDRVVVPSGQRFVVWDCNDSRDPIEALVEAYHAR